MAARASKPPRRKKEDSSQAAHRILETVIEKTERVIDPAVSADAAALSKLVASKVGEARAKSLTPKRRAEIAKAAARARWKKA
jgi:hypothetical protein